MGQDSRPRRPMKMPVKGNSKDAVATRVHKQKRCLDLLGQGLTVKEVMYSLGYKSSEAYYSWRKKSSEFKKRADAILAKRTPMPGSALLPRSDRRLEKFLEIYRQRGDRNQALVVADVSALLVEAVLDEESPEYDENFATRFRDAELRHIWEVEDQLMQQAKDNSGTTARFVLQARMPQRYNKPMTTSMAIHDKNLKNHHTEYHFYRVGENERTADEILEGVFKKALTPTTVGRVKEITDGRDDLPDQEARPDIQTIDVPDGDWGVS